MRKDKAHKSVTLGECRELAKKYGKEWNNEFIKWAREQGILKDPFKVQREHNDKLAQDGGYKDDNDRKQQWIRSKGYKNTTDYLNKLMRYKGYSGISDYVNERNHNKGRFAPLSESTESAQYLGTVISNKVAKYVLPIIYGEIKEIMPYGNKGFDVLMTDEKKIDIKSAYLRSNSWEFKNISRSDKSDYYLLEAFDNLEDLNLLSLLLIHKNEYIRKRKQFRGFNLVKMHDRTQLTISNNFDNEMSIKYFKKYDYIDKIDIEKLDKVLKEEFL